MYDLTNLELLVLTRCIGGLNSSEFRKGVNNYNCTTKVPFSLLESSDVNQAQNLYIKLKAAAKARGIDLEAGIVEVTVTTTEHLI